VGVRLHYKKFEGGKKLSEKKRIRLEKEKKWGAKARGKLAWRGKKETTLTKRRKRVPYWGVGDI